MQKIRFIRSDEVLATVDLTAAKLAKIVNGTEGLDEKVFDLVRSAIVSGVLPVIGKENLDISGWSFKKIEKLGTSVSVLSTEAHGITTLSSASAVAAFAPPPPNTVPVYPKDKLDTGSTTGLSAATQLYQPVNGTGGNSRYFVIALGNELNVAARWKGEDLALRIEGGNKKYAKQLSELSFGISEHHASLHVKVPNPHLAVRTVGAVLFALSAAIPSLEFRTGIPDMSVIAGKGS